MAIDIATQNIVQQYIDKPIWLNPFFYVAIGLVFIIICVVVYYSIRLHFKSRLGAIIHYPDGTFSSYFYKNFIGEVFKIKKLPNDIKEGDEYFIYFFRPQAIEGGNWGKRIHYNYLDSEPLILSEHRKKSDEQTKLFYLYQLISSYVNSDTISKILRSTKFEEYVKLFLLLLLIAEIIVLILVTVPFFTHGTQQCSLVANNQTLNVIRMAVYPQAT